MVRWDARFRAPRPSELVLIYSGSTPNSANAIRHSHPGNHHPHVHIHEHDAHSHQHHHRHDEDDPGRSHHDPSEHREHRLEEPHHSHEADHEEPEGHWHLAIPAHLVRGLYAILTVALSIVCHSISDLVSISPGQRFRAPARAPPSLAWTSRHTP
jgi:hypothetical protein